jgi:hypothetical protein
MLILPNSSPDELGFLSIIAVFWIRDAAPLFYILINSSYVFDPAFIKAALIFAIFVS